MVYVQSFEMVGYNFLSLIQSAFIAFVIAIDILQLEINIIYN